MRESDITLSTARLEPGDILIVRGPVETTDEKRQEVIKVIREILDLNGHSNVRALFIFGDIELTAVPRSHIMKLLETDE